MVGGGRGGDWFGKKEIMGSVGRVPVIIFLKINFIIPLLVDFCLPAY